jgi:hypothetical protein
MRQGVWAFLAAAGVFGMVACGGSSPSTPTAPPTPDTSFAPGTVLTVVSGETGEPLAGAHVVVSGRPYDTSSGGQVTIADRITYGSLLDVTAPEFLDRQTLLRKNSARRIVLWPRSTPWGLTESYTAELVYTEGSADPPPVGSSPLERIRRGTREVVVVVSDDIIQNPRINADHQVAIAHINEALAGKLTYLLSPATPPTGVVFQAQINPGDPYCGDRVLGYALMSYQSNEIVGGKLNYCTVQGLGTSLIAHELGHTLGLNHSSNYRDLMWRFSNGREYFSPAESLTLNMLFERPGGNRFPDNDRDVAAAGSGTRIVVCR